MTPFQLPPEDPHSKLDPFPIYVSAEFSKTCFGNRNYHFGQPLMDGLFAAAVAVGVNHDAVLVGDDDAVDMDYAVVGNDATN